MIRHSSRTAAFALLVLLAAAGCSPGGRPLARVGDKTITESDLLLAARGNEMQYPADPAAAKDMVLQDLVRREMMLQIAHRQGLDTLVLTRNVRAEAEERYVLQTLYAQLAPRDPGVSDAEVRRFYEWRNVEADAQMVYTLDHGSCAAALAEIQRGMPFDAASDRYSVQGMLPSGGHIAAVTPGSLIPPLDEALQKLPIGVIGGPYETPQGWFLLRVNSRHPRLQPPLEMQAAGLEDMLRQRKQRQALALAFADLKQEYRFQIHTGGPQALYAEMARLIGGGSPAPTAQQNRVVLADWDGGRYTLGDALLDLQRANRQKPPANNVAAIQSWIESQAMIKVAMVEARRRHLDEDPETALHVRTEVEGYVLEGQYSAATAAVPHPGPDEVRATFEQVKTQLAPRLSSVHLQWLVAADSAKAFLVATHGGHGGATLADAVKMADPSLAVHDETISFPTTDAQWAPLEATFLRMQPREWAGPEKTPAGWRLLQLEDKTAAPPTFEQLTPQQQQQLAGYAYNQACERAFGTYADSLRSVLHPVLVPENLAKVPWPPAPEAAAAP